MIFTFRIVSDEVDNFKREILIDADNTFLDLRNAICDSVGFDKNQMSSFFLCDRGWEKDKEITLEDMGMDSSDDANLMEDCILADYMDDEGQRLMFTFDYLADRSFFMELKKVEPRKHLSEPFCSVAMGNPPAQEMDMAEIDAKSDAKQAAAASDMDLDADFYGSDEYNDDEYSVDNYDEVNLED